MKTVRNTAVLAAAVALSAQAPQGQDGQPISPNISKL